MPKVFVRNHNTLEHREKFKGNEIVIPAGGAIEMDFEEAMEFKGQYTPMPPEDCLEPDLPKYYKKISVDMPKPEEVAGDAGFINPVTGKRFSSEKELIASLQQYAHLIAPRDEAAEKEADSPEKLKARIAELEAKLAGEPVEKRGPGRPKKAANG